MEENGSRSMRKLFDKAWEKNQESNTVYRPFLLKKGVESFAEGTSSFLKKCESGNKRQRYSAVSDFKERNKLFG